MDRREFIKISTAAAVTPAIVGCSGQEVIQHEGAPVSGFDRDATAELVTEGLDLSGKVAVVTGCNSGIGYETLRVLALRGAHVIGTGRTREKAAAACESVRGMTHPVALELGDFDSVAACSEEILSFGRPIDILVCNAGIRAVEHEIVNGVERDFAINHLGHFLLVNRLLGGLFAAPQGRIVVVSSAAAYGSSVPEGGIQFDNLDGRKGFETSTAYAHSKLANALFSRELARRLEQTRITSNALHPGVIKTAIARDSSALLNLGFSIYAAVSGKTLEEGAATSCYVATHHSLADISGLFFQNCNAVQIRGDNYLEDDVQAARLWQVSEDLTGSHLVDYSWPAPDSGMTVSDAGVSG
jgi:NAD(P)-dependent dehydrogenase (short-subunit alcohol dehydrogenase family)